MWGERETIFRQTVFTQFARSDSRTLDSVRKKQL